VGEFRQSVFASGAYMLYDHHISLLHVKQPHSRFLAVLVITVVLSRGDQPFSLGLQKRPPQHFIASGRDRHELDKNLNVSDM